MAGREPNFLIRGFDKNMKMIALAEASMFKSDGKVSTGRNVSILTFDEPTFFPNPNLVA